MEHLVKITFKVINYYDHCIINFGATRAANVSNVLEAILKITQFSISCAISQLPYVVLHNLSKTLK